MAGSAEAWDRLASHLQLESRLLQGEVVEVDAPEVKRVAGWEPRLLMKLDSRAQRPPVLERLQATVLPVRNGRYAIVPCDGYHDLEPSPPCRALHLSPSLRRMETLPWSSVPSSESQMLDMALASGMLADFLEEERPVLTIRGRLRAPAFRYLCRLHNGHRASLEADGVQVEVDAGLEGDAIHLLEAKLGARGDFHLRQLYFPFRMWESRATRPVKTVFCCYHDRQFLFWRYRFTPVDDYHAVRLDGCAAYTFDPEVALPDWRSVVAAALEQPQVPVQAPFPQADHVARIIDLVDALSQGIHERESLASRYDFVGRQVDYYLNAARFLGWVEPGGRNLTAEGTAFVAGSRPVRHVLLWEALARRPVFRQALGRVLESDALPSLEEIREWIAVHTELRGSTVARRAGTVLAWVRRVCGPLRACDSQQLSLF